MNKISIKSGDYLFYCACTLIIVAQICLGMFQIASYWQPGKAGFNGATALVAARNTIRHGNLWPAPLHTAPTKPSPSQLEIHTPLGQHLCTTAAVLFFGENEVAVRSTPALFSLLALIMLLVTVGRPFGRAHAVISGTIFILLPINTVYLNMPNSSAGCIFFALMMLDGYLNWCRTRKGWWLLPTVIGLAATTFFDWPGYVVACCMAVSALYDGFKRQGIGQPQPIHQILFALLVFSFVVISLKCPSLAMERASGVKNALIAITDNMMSSDIIGTLKEFHGKSIRTSFPTVARFLAVLWLAVVFLKHARRKWRREDIVPAAFFIAGTVQLLLFPAFVRTQYYWNWQYNPFVAIAAGQMVMWGVEIILKIAPHMKGITGRRLIKASAWIIPPALFFLLYAPKANEELRRGRATAGSFTTGSYDREYRKTIFFKLVASWTSPGDGIAIHYGLSHAVQLDAYLDRRIIKNISPAQASDPGKHLPRATKWVFIGDDKKADRRDIERVAREHPFIKIENFFFIDLSRKGGSVKVYVWKKKASSLLGKFLFTPYDPPLSIVRSTVLEERISSSLLGNVSP